MRDPRGIRTQGNNGDGSRSEHKLDDRNVAIQISGIVELFTGKLNCFWTALEGNRVNLL